MPKFKKGDIIQYTSSKLHNTSSKLHRFLVVDCGKHNYSLQLLESEYWDVTDKRITHNDIEDIDIRYHLVVEYNDIMKDLCLK